MKLPLIEVTGKGQETAIMADLEIFGHDQLVLKLPNGTEYRTSPFEFSAAVRQAKKEHERSLAQAEPSRR
jgi:hypothetical protein